MKRLLLASLLAIVPLIAQVGDMRGSGIQCSPGGAVPYTATINWPTGTASGDFGLIITGSFPAGTVTPPTGWSSLTTFGRNSFNGTSYTKILNAADITAGHTTFSTTVDNGTCVFIVTLIGNPGVVRNTNGSAAGASPASVGLTCSVNDLMIFFASAFYAVPTMTPGTLLGSAGYATSYASPAASAGACGSTATWTGGSSNSGVLMVLIENAGGISSFVANPSIFGIAVQ
jgi:hypothetical protein